MQSNIQHGTSETAIQGKEFTVTRTFHAPRATLFKMWSEAQHLKQWWGPKGWSVPVCEVDFRPGGSWLYCMKGEMPDGTTVEAWGRAHYREIESPSRIVYLDTFVDEKGELLDGMPQMVISIDFIDRGDKTEVRSTTTFATEDDLKQTLEMGMVEGMNESFDRLDELIARQKS
jgi:uncharacterized protein YndB with AHSA1/START domain